MAFEKLFEPITIGNMTIKNRLVMPPMDSGLPNNDGTVNERTVAYYEARAKGGIGLIIVEYTHVDPKGKPLNNTLGVYDDKYIPGLTELASACHKHGAKILLQLHHCGRSGSPYYTGTQLEAPSAVACPAMKSIPHAFTTQEVYDLIEKWGDGALRAKKAGFDGVELHGGHGYLLHEFMSGFFNKRNDEFGGDFRSRMLFPELIIKNIQKKCGMDFPITMRVSGNEYVNGGKCIEETRAGVHYLEQFGLKAVNVSLGNYTSSVRSVPSHNIHIGFNIDSAESVKKSVNIPVIGGGRLHDPYYADDALNSGRVDMVFMGRACLADPEFPNKIKEGRYDEIIKCTGCLQRCFGHIGGGKDGISCMQNPFTGKEYKWSIEPTETPKNIVVVGAGPGGLEAAWIMAKRGHHVTVLEKENTDGGQFNVAAIPPYKHELPGMIKTYRALCKRYGVEIKYNTEATVDMLLEMKPDEVVLATGGMPLVPNIPGIDGENVVHAVDLLNGKTLIGGNILILGGGEVGLETADFLGERYNRITVMDMIPEVARGMNVDFKTPFLARLRSYGVQFVMNAKITKICDDGVEYVDVTKADSATLSLNGFDKVVVALGSKSYNPLGKELAGKLSTHVIGDAVKARTAVEAIEEAAELAIRI